MFISEQRQIELFSLPKRENREQTYRQRLERARRHNRSAAPVLRELTADERRRLASAGIAPVVKGPTTAAAAAREQSESTLSEISLDVREASEAGLSVAPSATKPTPAVELPLPATIADDGGEDGDMPAMVVPRRIKSDAPPAKRPPPTREQSGTQPVAVRRSATLSAFTATSSRSGIAASRDGQPRPPSQMYFESTQRWLGERIRKYVLRLEEIAIAQTYYCQICLFNYDKKEGVAMACGHFFCQDCLAAYVTVKINEGLVLGLRCPHVDDADSAGANDAELDDAGGCSQLITADDMRGLLELDEALVARFTRLLTARTDDKYRECPQCAAPNTDGPTARSNRLTCGECQTTFCFVHANAHPGIGCRQYERRQRREEKLNREAVEQFARRCPGCSFPVEKAGGCNHLTCPQCATHFCWLCGKSYPQDAIGEHYSTGLCRGLHLEEGFRRAGMTNDEVLRKLACRNFARTYGLPLAVTLALALWWLLSPWVLLTTWRCEGDNPLGLVSLGVLSLVWVPTCCVFVYPLRRLLRVDGAPMNGERPLLCCGPTCNDSSIRRRKRAKCTCICLLFVAALATWIAMVVVASIGVGTPPLETPPGNASDNETSPVNISERSSNISDWGSNISDWSSDPEVNNSEWEFNNSEWGSGPEPEPTLEYNECDASLALQHGVVVFLLVSLGCTALYWLAGAMVMYVPTTEEG